MENMQFGLKALGKETPTPVKWIYRIAGLIGSVWSLVVATYPNIPVEVQVGVFKAATLGTSIIYTICQFVGWDKENKS